MNIGQSFSIFFLYESFASRTQSGVLMRLCFFTLLLPILHKSLCLKSPLMFTGCEGGTRRTVYSVQTSKTFYSE